MLKDRKILLGVTGSIAAYKSADIVRRLIDKNANVKVVMSEAACRFITPYTFEVLTRQPVYTDLFKDPFSHIDLAKESDLFIIAPATANTINKLSCGIADNLLSNIWLAHDGPTIMAPSMNERMYHHRIVKRNIEKLEKAGVRFVGPEKGSLACGDEGVGRMSDTIKIVNMVEKVLIRKDLKGCKILISAGPTREAIDPVRYISNRSSGKMGYALAKAADIRGARVTLISGPSSENPVEGIKMIPVEDAAQMESAIIKNMSKCDALIMAAAVSDFAPAESFKVKRNKNSLNALKLKQTTDILRKISNKKGKRVFVGFAAESSRDIKSAKKKLIDKGLDFIVLNDVNQEGAGFEVDTNIVTIIDKNGAIVDYPLMNKIDVANAILDNIKVMRE